MISNQTLQNTIDGLHQITKVDFAVVDSEGGVLASTLTNPGQYRESAVTFAISEAESQVVSGCQFFKVYDEQQLEFIVLAKGTDEEEALLVGKIATFQIQELMVAYRERFDKDNFIKNLLLDNLLLVDIYNRSKKLHVDINARRVVMIVETGEHKDGDSIDRVRSLFSGKTKDFVTAVDEHNIIVVKELTEQETYDDIRKTAAAIIDALKDRDDAIRVSYGTIVGEIKEVSRSYKEAGMALDVGKHLLCRQAHHRIFSTGHRTPDLSGCRFRFAKCLSRRSFDGKDPDDFDEETLSTINKFFENSLNVSETSRQLYIHRNTLVYRLDKLQKSTGLDPRL